MSGACCNWSGTTSTLSSYRSSPAARGSRACPASIRQLSAVLSILVYAGDGDHERRFQEAARQLEVDKAALLPREQVSVADFSRAVHALADCYPLLKPRILKAMVLAAGDNGSLNATEREIICSIAAVMDCPVPTLPGT